MARPRASGEQQLLLGHPCISFLCACMVASVVSAWMLPSGLATPLAAACSLGWNCLPAADGGPCAMPHDRAV